MSKAKKERAVIALYGARHCGFGYLAHRGEKVSEDPMGFANGMPEGEGSYKFESATEALFAAHRVLAERGVGKSVEVAVHMDLPRGPSVAFYEAHPPVFGDLKWQN